MRKKIRNQDRKFKTKIGKNLSSAIVAELGLSDSDKGCYEKFFQNLIKGIKILKDNKDAQFEDERFLLENLVAQIAEKKLTLNSINFKKICTQIRMKLDKSNINYISNEGKDITYSFQEGEVNITPKEYEFYIQYKDNEKVLRAIFGIESQTKEYPNRISFGDSSKVSQNNNINSCQNFNSHFNAGSNLNFNSEQIKSEININNLNSSQNSQNFSHLSSININNNVLNSLISMCPVTPPVYPNLLRLYPSLFGNYNLYTNESINNGSNAESEKNPFL